MTEVPHAAGHSRIAGLDAWRAVLMLAGVALHASYLNERRALFDAIALVSGSFRMGSFYAISGLLSGFTLARRPARGWLSERYLQLGVPTAFALTAICPLISVLLLWRTDIPVEARHLRFDWYHAWFLVGLMLYARIAWSTHRLDARLGLFARIEAAVERMRPPAVLLGLAAVSLAAMVMTRAGLIAVLSLDPLNCAEAVTQCGEIVGYAPLFLFGLVLARAPTFRARMLARWRPPAAMLGGIAMLYVVWYGGVIDAWPAHGAVDAYVRMIGAALGPPAATVLIVRSAIAIAAVPPWVRRLAAASFTIYLLHFPIAVLTNLLFARIGWNVYVEYGLTILIAGGLSFFFHEQAVRRSRTLAFLLNGKRPAPVVTGVASVSR